MPLEPPYVSAALFCDKAIEGKDGAISVIRVIDRVQAQAVLDEQTMRAIAAAHGNQGPNMVIQFTGLFSVKAGELQGKFTIRIDVVNPIGKRTEVQKFPADFHGADTGMNIIINFALGVEVDGIHWFELFFEERLLTRVPLNITRLQPQVAAAV